MNCQSRSRNTKTYDVAEVPNFQTYRDSHFLISQPHNFLVTHILIWLGLIIFYVFTAYLTPIPLLAITVFFNVLTQIFLIALGLTDPGIVPKILQNYQYTKYKGIPLNSLYQTGQMRDIQRSYGFTIKSHSLSAKFCNTCYIYRPPRTSHCHQCNICVQNFDHHCPWIGTCVGKHNYRYFLGFITSMLILCSIVCAEAILFVITIPIENLPFFILNIILTLYCLVGIGFAGILVVFHLYLLLSNTTTNQFCKKTWNSVSGNPFSKNRCFVNCLKIFGSNGESLAQPSADVIHRNQINKDQIQEQIQNQPNTMQNIPRRKSNSNSNSRYKERRYPNFSVQIAPPSNIKLHQQL